ncbi:glycosyltransferase family 2 protein [Alkalicoccus luteus]|uniref:glycosyltransferase family 2 protein n=1 Tax=Alkalicoccus luteus TaxID=1237094 RepID=UPI0040333BBE
MELTKISVIVPFMNVEAYLEECLESLAKQTHPNLEIVMIDDGSTDGGSKIAAAYADQYSHFYLYSQANQGVAEARNHGIRRATGEWIGFVDSDDWVRAEMFKQLHKAAEKTSSDIAVCGHARQYGARVTAFNDEVKSIVLNREQALHELFKGELYRFALWNKLYKKSLFVNITFPSGKIHEDLAISPSLFTNAEKTVVLSWTGYVYRARENSILMERYHKGRMDSYEAWEYIIEKMTLEEPAVMPEVWRRYTWWTIDALYTVMQDLASRKEANQFFGAIRTTFLKNYDAIAPHITDKKTAAKIKMIRSGFFYAKESNRLLVVTIMQRLQRGG